MKEFFFRYFPSYMFAQINFNNVTVAKNIFRFHVTICFNYNLLNSPVALWKIMVLLGRHNMLVLCDWWLGIQKRLCRTRFWGNFFVKNQELGQMNNSDYAGIKSKNSAFEYKNVWIELAFVKIKYSQNFVQCVRLNYWLIQIKQSYMKILFSLW